jgi:6-phosphofructo-2-kinase / fructose-2,6-biphosphatase 2
MFVSCSNPWLWMKTHENAYSYAYFHNLPQADLPYIKIPLHTVIKLTPKAYGCDEERYALSMHSCYLVAEPSPRFTLPIGAVDTHRPKPTGDVTIAPASSKREYFGVAK